MRCPQCGHLNPDGIEECEECEINLAWAAENIKEPCPACGTMNPVLSTKCSNCGLNLELHREKQRREEEKRKRQGQAAVEAQVTTQTAVKNANGALIGAIVGFFICGIILGPYAIQQARKVKAVLGPGDPGYGTAQAAEIIGWIDVVLWALVIAAQICNAIGSY